MQFNNIYSWTIPLLFHNMFSHAFFHFMVRRSIQSTSLNFTRNQVLPIVQTKIYEKIQDKIQDKMQNSRRQYHTMQSLPIPTVPFCHTCKYFKPIMPKENGEIGQYYGTCKFFTKINPITHINEPLFAHEARRSDSYCGKEGRYYSLHPVFRI